MAYLENDDQAQAQREKLAMEPNPQKREVLATELSSYDERVWKSREPTAAQREAHQDRMERLYTDSDNYWKEVDESTAGHENEKAALARSNDRAGDKARWANQEYLANYYRKPRKEVIDNYEALQADWMSKNAQYLDAEDDQAFYGVLQHEVTKDKHRRVFMTDLARHAQKEAMRGGAGGVDAFTDFTSNRVEALMSTFDAANPAKERHAYDLVYEEVKKNWQPFQEPAEKIFNALATQYGAEGFDEKDSKVDPEFDMEAMAAQLEAMPKEDRQKVFSLMALKADELGMDKGFWKQWGESFYRGAVEDVGKGHLRNLKRAYLINLESESDSASLFHSVDRSEYDTEEAYADALIDSILTTGEQHRIGPMGGDLGFQRPTAAESEIIRARADQLMKRMDMADELRQVAEGVVDPIKGDNFITEKIIYPATRNAPFTLQAFVPYAGIPLLMSSSLDNRYQEVRQRNPDMEAEDVQTIAGISALIEGPIEYVDRFLLVGKIPGLKKLSVNLKTDFITSGITKRAAGFLGANITINQLQEAGQDIMPLMVQATMSHLKKDIPGIDWDKELPEFGNQRWDVLWASIPQTLIGTGVATFKSQAVKERFMTQWENFENMGLSDKEIQTIIFEKNTDKRDKLLKEAFTKRDVQASVEKTTEMVDRTRAAQDALNTSTATPDVDKIGNEYIVTDPEGNELLRTESEADANEARTEWMREESDRVTQATADMTANVNEYLETGSSVSIEEGTYTLQDKINERVAGMVEGITDSKKREAIVKEEMARAYQAMAAAGLAMRDPAKIRILGTNEAEFTDGVFRDVSRIWKGSATPLTVQEERSEGFIKRMMSSFAGKKMPGSLSLEQMAVFKSQYEDATGQADPKYNMEGQPRAMQERIIVEWFSDMANTYLTARAPDPNVQDLIPGSVVAYLEQEKSRNNTLMEWSTAMIKASEAGKIPKEFEQLLERATGLDRNYRHTIIQEKTDQQKEDEQTRERSPPEVTFAMKMSTPVNVADAVRASRKYHMQMAERVAREDVAARKGGGDEKKFGKERLLLNIESAVRRKRVSRQQAEPMRDFVTALDSSLLGDVEAFIGPAVEDSVRGRFGMMSGLLEVFTDYDRFSETGIHELWHSLTRYMPNGLRDRMIAGYAESLDGYVKENPWFAAFVGRKTLSEDQYSEYSKFVDQKIRDENLERVAATDKVPAHYRILFSNENYRYISADEWVVGNLTDLAADRLAIAQETQMTSGHTSWIDAFRRIFHETQKLARAMLTGPNEFEQFYDMVFDGEHRLEMANPLGVMPEGMRLYDPGAPSSFVYDQSSAEDKKWAKGFVPSKSLPEGMRPPLSFNASQMAAYSRITPFLESRLADYLATVSDRPARKLLPAGTPGGMTRIMRDISDAVNSVTTDQGMLHSEILTLAESAQAEGHLVSATVMDQLAQRATGKESYVELLQDMEDSHIETQRPQFYERRKGAGGQIYYMVPEQDTTFSLAIASEKWKAAVEANDMQSAQTQVDAVAVMANGGVGPIYQKGKAIKTAVETIETEMIPVRHEPVTRDESGDIIPLEKRFNLKPSNIVHSMTPEEVSAANPATITMSMQPMEEEGGSTTAGWLKWRDMERKMKERRITQRVATGEHKGEPFSDQLQERVKNKLYPVMPNKFTFGEALRLLEHGLERANNKFFNDQSGLHPAVRNALGQILLTTYHEMGDMSAAAEVAIRLAELGTQGGQGIQVLNNLGLALDTPEKATAFYAKQVSKVKQGVLGSKNVEAARNITKEVFELANQLFGEWIDKFIGTKKSKKAVDLDIFPDVTFSLEESTLEAVAAPVVTILREQGSKAADEALVARYGDGVKEHLATIKSRALEMHLSDIGRSTAESVKIKKKVKKQLVKTALDKMKARGLKTPRQVAEAVEKVMEMVDQGEISMAEIDQVFAEKYKIPDATPEVTKKLSEMAKRIARLPEGSDVRRNAVVDMMDFIHDQFKKTDLVDIFWGIWYSNILSGYNTHLRNLGDTGLQVLFDSVIDSVSLNPLHLGRTVQRLAMAWFGMGAGMKFGLKEAYRHVKTGQQMIGRDTVSKFGARGALERLKGKMHKWNPWVWTKVVGRMLIAEDGFWFHTAAEIKARQIALEMARTENLSGKALFDRAEEMLHLTDEQLADHQEQAEQEWSKLLPGDVEDLKLTIAGYKKMGHDEMRSAWIQRRVEELKRLNRDGLLQERASEFAARATYNYTPEGTIGALAQALGLGLHGIQNSKVLDDAIRAGSTLEKSMAIAVKAAAGVGTPLMPFTRIVANVLNKWLDYTPMGIVRGTLFKDHKVVLEGGNKIIHDKSADQASLELKKGLFGTSMIFALLNMDPDDDDTIKIHGEGTGDWGKNKQLMGTDWIPYSWQIGDTYISYKQTPLAFLMSWVGNIHDKKRYKPEDLEDKNFIDRSAYAMAGAGKLLLSQSFVTTMADFVEIMGRSEEAAIRGLERFSKRTLDPSAVAVPFSNLFRHVNAAFDPYLRDNETITATMMAKVPVVSRWDQPALDMLGQPIDSRPMAWLVSTPRDNPQRRTWMMIAEKQAFIKRIWQYKNKMPAGMWYEFQKARGQEVQRLILSRSPGGDTWLDAMEKMTPERAQDRMDKFSSIATKRARKLVGYVPEKKK